MKFFNIHWRYKDFLKSRKHMLINKYPSNRVPCNGYSKRSITTSKRPKAFNMKVVNNSLCLGRNSLWILFNRCTCCPNLVTVTALKKECLKICQNHVKRPSQRGKEDWNYLLCSANFKMSDQSIANQVMSEFQNKQIWQWIVLKFCLAIPLSSLNICTSFLKPILKWLNPAPTSPQLHPPPPSSF